MLELPKKKKRSFVATLIRSNIFAFTVFKSLFLFTILSLLVILFGFFYEITH